MTVPGETPTLTVGSVVADRFQVISKLGEGGMGVVYRVRHVVTGGLHALKMLHPAIATSDVRARLVQEAQVGARIQSDHLVKVTDAGFDGHGLPYFVMELLDGANLDEVVTYRKHLSKTETLSIFHQLCHGLGAAHRANIIHRDIKPLNILLTRTKAVDAGLFVKILDFGIAKVLVEAGGHATATIQGGTFPWAPPEQWNPEAKPRPTMDVWPLGLLAFYLMTGFYYWESENEISRQGAPGTLSEVLGSPLVPASERLRRLGGAPELLPADFDGWFAQCVNRDPEQRFSNATLALKALTQTMGHDGRVEPIDVEILPPRLPTPLIPALGENAESNHGSDAQRVTAPEPRAGSERVEPSAKAEVLADSKGRIAPSASVRIPDAPQRASPSRRSTLIWFGAAGAGLVAAGFGLSRLSSSGGSASGAGSANPRSAGLLSSASSAIHESTSAPAPVASAPSSKDVAWRRTNVLDAIRKRGVLLVGVEDDAPPLNYKDEKTEKRTGFDYEVIQAIAASMAITSIKHIETPFDKLPGLLKDGTVDVIMSGQVADMAQKDTISWSDGYLEFGACLIAKKGSGIEGLKDVIESGNGKVAIYAGDARLKKWLIQQGVKEANLVERDQTGWMKVLSSGEADAIVYDYPFAIEELKKFPDLRIVQMNLAEWRYVIAMPAGNTDLIQAINDALDREFGSKRDSPKYAKLVRTYLAGPTLDASSLPPGTRVYTVRTGESIRSIAQSQLGNEKLENDLWTANKTRFGNKLLVRPGDKLVLP